MSLRNFHSPFLAYKVLMLYAIYHLTFLSLRLSANGYPYLYICVCVRFFFFLSDLVCISLCLYVFKAFNLASIYPLVSFIHFSSKFLWLEQTEKMQWQGSFHCNYFFYIYPILLSCKMVEIKIIIYRACDFCNFLKSPVIDFNFMFLRAVSY